MGMTFAEAHRVVIEGKDPDKLNLVLYMLDGFREGRLLASGIPPEMSPAEVFRQTRYHLKYVFAFRLTTVDPPGFSCGFSSFRDSTFNFRDYGTLLFKTQEYLEASAATNGHGRPTTPKLIPVEGAILIFDPDPEDREQPLDVIALHPPEVPALTFRRALYNAVDQCLKRGFYPATG